jgi:hypothetical protein
MLLRNPYDEPRGVLSDEQLRDYYALKTAMNAFRETNYEAWERLGQLASFALHSAILDECYGVDRLTMTCEIREAAHVCRDKGMRYDGFRHWLIMNYRYSVLVEEEYEEDEEDEDAGDED